MKQFVIITHSKHHMIESCYFFSNEDDAAKYALLLQFKDCNLLSSFNNDSYEESWLAVFKDIITLFKQGKYIEAYKQFSDYYWEIMIRPIYYFENSDISELNNLDNFKFEVENFTLKE